MKFALRRRIVALLMAYVLEMAWSLFFPPLALVAAAMVGLLSVLLMEYTEGTVQKRCERRCSWVAVPWQVRYQVIAGIGPEFRSVYRARDQTAGGPLRRHFGAAAAYFARDQPRRAGRLYASA